MATRSEQDAAIDLTKLPYLTARRAALVLDCNPRRIAKLLTHVGMRGRQRIYRTEDVLALAAGLRTQPAVDAAANATTEATEQLAPVISLADVRRAREGGQR